MVFLNNIDPKHISMELYADDANGGEPVRIKMEPDSIPRTSGEYIYHAKVESSKPAIDFTPRIIPAYENISVPLEDNLIVWQR